jgi:hypothetical protein
MAVESLSGSIDTSISAGTAWAANGSTNTKGAYTQLVASSGIAAESLVITLSPGTAEGDFLFDIATGAAASEVDKIANIPYSRKLSIPALASSLVLPFNIPAGSRIAARQQSTTTTGILRAGIHITKKDTVSFHECTSSVTYGAVTADSGGTSVDPGGTIHTKGAYSELSASTSADIKWLMVCIQQQNNTSRSTANFLIDIATGAAASESVIIPNIWVVATTEADLVQPIFIGPFPIEIASGTRLAVRAQCSINDATDRLLDVILLGFNGTASGGGSGGAHFSAGFMG